MKISFTIIISLMFTLTLFSQDIRVEKPVFPEGQTSDWGTDRVILNNEPIGPMYGIQTSDGAIYVAINDTLSTANLGLVIKKSVDGGINWTTEGGITYRGIYDNIKLLKSSTDNVYCFFMAQTGVYSWDIATPTVNIFNTSGYRAFDVEITSSNSLYLFLDSLPSNQLIRYSSINGGLNWGTRGLISSSAAFPKVTKSLSGDTLFLNYYGPPLADTATSIIRVARYRETAPGTVLSATFMDIATEAVPKKEFAMSISNGVVWFLYTQENVRSEIWARRSVDNGASYGPAFKVAETDPFNQYWFDVKAKPPAGNGFSFVYFSDSLQSGPATTLTDRIMFAPASQDAGNFSPFVQINDNPAVKSDMNYKPVLVELPSINNTGVVWVGEDAGGKKVYWDTFDEIPVEFTSFTAISDNNNVTLQWSTATETNNHGFEIERSEKFETGANGWTTVGFINGHGTTTEVNKYTYFDRNIKPGKYIYRLKQIDFDGSYSYSKEIEVDVNGLPVEFALYQNYPNPFNPSTIISFSIPKAEFVTLKIYDILGNEVKTLVNEQKEAGVYKVEFSAGSSGNASKLSSGVYFYKLFAGEFSFVKKLILAK